MKTIIESLGVYLPARSVSTEEVLRACRTRVRFPLEKLTGIRSRRMAGEHEFSFDLAREAARDCLHRSRRTPEDVDLLISCSISRCDGPHRRCTFEPSTAVRLAAVLGCRRAHAFDLSNACTGMFTGILVADAYLKLGLARCAMVVSGEYITHLTETAQQAIEDFMDPRLACLTLGDAGAALLLEAAPGDAAGLHAIDMFTLGRYSSYCIAKATPGGPMMFTDSVKITEIAVQPAVANTAEIIARAGAPLRSIEHIVLHQTSRTTLRDAARVINQFFPGMADETNTIDNLAERGNTASTSHFVAVMDHVRNGRIRSGDNVVFGISGSGQTLGTALYTFDDLPDRLRRAPAPAPPDTAPPAARDSGGAPVASRVYEAVSPASARVRIESVGTAARGALGRTSIELCREAGLACLAASSHARDEIDVLIHAGVYRTECLIEPAMAATIAGDLGINDVFEPGAARRTLAFDVFNGGVGFLDACHVAAQLIRAGSHRTALVIASEIDDPRLGEPRGLAEAASAVILDAAEAGSGAGFGGFAFHRFPGHAGALTASIDWEAGAVRLRVARDAELEATLADCARAAVGDLLAAEAIERSRLAVVLPPQTSPAFVARLAGALEVPAARCADVSDGAGDLFTSSIGYALQDVLTRKLVAPGDVGLMVTAGAGLAIGCAIYYF